MTSRTRVAGGTLAVTVIVGALSLQARGTVQQRDTPVAATVTGTAQIAGVVLTNEATPKPMRRAIVSIGGEIPARSVMTDDEGRFTFSRLPAGRFTVTARKPAYLLATYGSTRPGRPGNPVAVARDQRVQITLTMTRGAVLTGVLRDRHGVPLAGVQVAALDTRTAGGTDNLFTSAEYATSDDRGVYRLFGLAPSAYVVAATQRLPGSGVTGTRSTTEMDGLLATLAQRANARTSSTTPPRVPAPLLPNGAAVGFAPTYFPGSTLFAEATRVTLAAGEERGGLDFVVGPVPAATISGGISGEVQNLAGVTLSIVIGGPRLPPQLAHNPVLTERPDAQGQFKYTNVAPGHYRIVARARRGQTQGPPTPSRGGGSAGSSGAAPVGTNAGSDMLYAVADVDVLGEHVTGVTLQLQPGSVFAGRVAVEAVDPKAPPNLGDVRVNVVVPGGTYYSGAADGTIVGNTFSAVPPVVARADGSFEIHNIAPGHYGLRLQLPPALAKQWWLASAMAGGRDLLDWPLDFLPGRNLSDVVLTLTDNHNELGGRLQTAAGTAAPEYFVVVFPADRTLWRAGLRRLRSTRPASDGSFSFADLPAGEYLLAALTDVDAEDWQTPEMLAQITLAGLKIAVAATGKTVQNLRIAKD